MLDGIIRAFAAHRIAPNLLLLIMVVSGVLVLDRLETRFFPEFNAPVVRVTALWTGAAAEDVDASLLTPLENELRNVPDLDEMTSVAADGLGLVYLEFPDGTDLAQAAEDVRRYLDLAAGKLPAEAETPEAQALEFIDEVMRLSMTGADVREMRRLARRLESDLAGLGVVRVELTGLPSDRLEVRLDRRRLAELNLTPAAIAAQISAQNVDATAGDVDGAGASRLLRALAKREEIDGLNDLPIVDGAGNLARLGDVAEIVRTEAPDETAVFFNGKPAVQFDLTRRSGASALEAGERVTEWLAQVQLPAGVTLTAHKEEWRLIRSRLDLLIENGLQGLLLVLALLFLFLRWRLAFWVAAGIPATFMVALSVLFFAGGSIDMLTMFAFIMTTGIVVDDAIVVGENALHHAQMKKPPLEAAVVGAREMFPAVFSSTFTTIGSFMPLMMIGGPIGSIIFVIPLVVICVLTAALFECFTVLPGHIAGAFRSMRDKPAGGLRHGIEAAFERFQEGPFRAAVRLALRYRAVVIVTAFVLMALSVALFVGGAVKFRFFPGADLNRVVVQAEFVAGTPRETVRGYMETLYAELERIAAANPDEEIVRSASLLIGRGYNADGVAGGGAVGDQVASLYLEMGESEARRMTAPELSELWRARAPEVSGLKNLSIREESGGPPGADVDIRLAGGGDTQALKQAALALQTALRDVPGVSELRDDMPYGKNQIVFELTSLGRSLDLSVADIARQLRDAFDGVEVQTFYDGVDEVALRVVLEGGGGKGVSDGENLAGFLVRLPNGNTAALQDLVTIGSRRGFDTIQRVNAEPVVHVRGAIDYAVTDAGTVLRQMEADILPDIVATYGVGYSQAGGRADEEKTIADMKTGLLVAAVMIFVILAAVFASWTLPMAIILTAPLGLIGAIWGHWLMGVDMSILSMFGIFTLNGIVINDSIVLVRDYLARREKGGGEAEGGRGRPGEEWIVDAVCRRFRAILLTSLTTIGGLTPLMFETSTQAQFLIPMAVSVCFGLAFATLLILFVMPVYVSVHESLGRGWRWLWR